jgi:hypothetical protein
MEELRTDKVSYNPNDLSAFQEKGTLEITPKFQRRPVWKTPARSYFIDTMLRGMTVPPMYFRLTQNPARTTIIREVVDGQQRIRAVLDYMEDEFRLSKTLNASWAGKRFSQLSHDEQLLIRQFSFPVEVFKGITDKQVLEVFCRLNINGVPLSKQELRNGQWFGRFKQCSFELALAYLQLWRQHRIFTEQAIARMLEVELTSELLIAGNCGMQDKKNSIDKFYSEWDDAYPTRSRDEQRFKATMNEISETFVEQQLSDTIFRRPPMFYTLYCSVFHHIFGLPGIQRRSPKKKLSTDEKDSLREAVETLSTRVAEAKNPEVDTPSRFKPFVLACQRQTDNIIPRKTRFDALYDAAF